MHFIFGVQRVTDFHIWRWTQFEWCLETMWSTRLLDLTTLELHTFSNQRDATLTSLLSCLLAGIVCTLLPRQLQPLRRYKEDPIPIKAEIRAFPLRYCWVDSWSIDQDDPEDKARKIPLMGSRHRLLQLQSASP